MDQQTQKKSPNSPMIWVASIVVLILIIAIGWYLFFNENNATNNTNQSNNSNVSKVPNITITDGAGSKTVLDNDFKYVLQFPISWHSKIIESAGSDLGVGVQRLVLQNIPFDLELHPKKDETVVSVSVHSITTNLSSWYDEYKKSHPRDIYKTVTVDSGLERINETIVTGSQPKRPIDTEWLDGKVYNTFLLVGYYVVQVEGVVSGEMPKLHNDVTDVLNSLQKS